MKRPFILAMVLALWLAGCNQSEEVDNKPEEESMKINVYQVFTRLFGNSNTTNKAWGTLEENGVGKFTDFNDRALEGIKELGITHIWYTGVLHHAMVTDYPEIGIPGDDPDVVKGRAGSPYSVKDYYNVNPDLAEDPSRRLEEFEALTTFPVRLSGCLNGRMATRYWVEKIIRWPMAISKRIRPNGREMAQEVHNPICLTGTKQLKSISA